MSGKILDEFDGWGLRLCSKRLDICRLEREIGEMKDELEEAEEKLLRWKKERADGAL